MTSNNPDTLVKRDELLAPMGTMDFVNMAFRNIDIALSSADLLDIADALAAYRRSLAKKETEK